MLRWRADGRELYYISSDLAVMAVEVTPGPALKLGVAKKLFTAQMQYDNPPFYRWDVSPDGQRFYIDTTTEEDVATRLEIVSDWRSLLRK